MKLLKLKVQQKQGTFAKILPTGSFMCHSVALESLALESLTLGNHSGARDTNFSSRLRLKSSEGFSLFVKISEKAIPVKDDNFFFDFVRQLTELLKKNKRASEAALLTYQGNLTPEGALAL